MSSRLRHITRMTFIRILLLWALMCCVAVLWDKPPPDGSERDIMARGAPDYSNVTSAQPLHRLDDMSEIPVRLGSPVTHDRAGKIVSMETFRFGVSHWHAATYGTGSEVVASPTYFRSGPFSCKMVCGSDGARAAKIFKYFPLPVLGQYGVEISIMPEVKFEQLLYRLTYYDGTNANKYLTLYHATNETLRIEDADAGYVTLDSDLDLAFQFADFHTFKSVCDLENDKWVRVIVNDSVHTVPDYSPVIAADTTSPSILLEITVYGESGGNGFCYIDDIIITQAEP